MGQIPRRTERALGTVAGEGREQGRKSQPLGWKPPAGERKEPGPENPPPRRRPAQGSGRRATMAGAEGSLESRPELIVGRLLALRPPGPAPQPTPAPKGGIPHQRGLSHPATRPVRPAQALREGPPKARRRDLELYGGAIAGVETIPSGSATPWGSPSSAPYRAPPSTSRT